MTKPQPIEVPIAPVIEAAADVARAGYVAGFRDGARAGAQVGAEAAVRALEDQMRVVEMTTIERDADGRPIGATKRVAVLPDDE